jgi:hypothetical protein
MSTECTWVWFESKRFGCMHAMRLLSEAVRLSGLSFHLSLPCNAFHCSLTLSCFASHERNQNMIVSNVVNCISSGVGCSSVLMCDVM